MYQSREEYEENRVKDNTFLYGILNGTHLKEMGDSIYKTEPLTYINPYFYAEIFKDGTAFRHVSAGTNKYLGRLYWHGIDIFFKFPRYALRTVC